MTAVSDRRGVVGYSFWCFRSSCFGRCVGWVFVDRRASEELLDALVELTADVDTLNEEIKCINQTMEARENKGSKVVA